MRAMQDQRVDDLPELFCCPECGGALGQGERGWLCEGCGREYPVREGIPHVYSDRVRELTNGAVAAHSTADEVTDANIRYHDKVAKDYEGDFSTRGIYGEDTGSQRRIPEALRRFARETTGRLLVDTGCGTGNVVGHASKFFEHAVGIDVSLGMLQQAHGRGLSVCLGDAEKLPFGPGAADVMTAFSVIHHFFDQRPFFSECARVLRKGGVLYTDWDPNAAYEAETTTRRYRLAQKLYHLSMRTPFTSRTIVQKTDKSLEGISEMAEYHHHYNQGLDPAARRTTLLDLGFDDVDIYYHEDTPSLFGGAGERISNGQRLVNLLMFGDPVPERSKFPRFALVAHR